MVFGIVKYFVVLYCRFLIWMLHPIWMRVPLVGLIYLFLKRIVLRANNVRPVPIIDDYEITENDTPRDVRSFEGSMNNEKKSSMGMIGCPFARNVRVLKNPCGDADVVHLSKVLLRRKGRAKLTKLVNTLGCAWPQFMSQDWFIHRLDKSKQISFDLGNGETMKIDGFAKTTIEDESYNVNGTDHWWSCSQIYGYTKEQAEKRRTKSDGKLIVDEYGFIPMNNDGVEQVGFPRNMWIGTSLLHWLFTMEHNRVCMVLKTYYPHLNTDELLYQKARLIITAMIAKIHVVEWSTAMIQNPLGRAVQYFTWYGLLGTFCGKKVKLPFKGILSSILSGMTGNRTIFADQQNYAHSDEYSAIFRMHSMMPDEIQIRSIPDEGEQQKQEQKIGMNDLLFGNSAKVFRERGAATVAYTLGLGRAGQIALQNHPMFLDRLHYPRQAGFGYEGECEEGVIDIGVADIFRCREMRLPLFNEFRRQYNLRPYKSFKDFTRDPELIQALNSAYGGDIEKMDTYVGLIGEKRCPGFTFGETMYTIFVLQTQRRLECDRFFTTDFNERVYTPRGIQLVEDTTMSELLRTHIPELRRFIDKSENAFIPWDVTKKRGIHERVIFDMLFPYSTFQWFSTHRFSPCLTRFLPPHLDRKHRFFEDGQLHQFNPTSHCFDPVNAWWLSEACFLSYFEEPYFQRTITNSLPTCHVQLIDNHRNTQIHVVSTDQYVWAIFRGTEWWPRGGAGKGSLLQYITDDWTVDLDTVLVQESEVSGVMVHKAFQIPLNELWNDLMKALECAKYGNENKPIFFAGHSVGGALAIIAGLRYNVQGIYTYGAPAVGNEAYVNIYTQRGSPLYNVVNNDDVFPRLLMPKLLQPGTFVHITKEGRLRMNESPRAYSAKFSGKTKSLLESLVVDYAVLDHSPVMYSTQLWNQISPR